MYDLYIGNKNYSSWSLRPWVLLKERGIGFEEKLVPFTPGGSPGFRSFSPSGKVPALTDGETGTVVWDSLAITEYLAEKNPRAGVWPMDPLARAWARCASAEMHSGFGALRSTCSMNVGIRIKLHEVSAPLAADLARIGSLWTEGLEKFKGPFLAGATFSAVDAFFAPVAFRIQTYGLAPSLPAAAAEYANRLLALPSMRAWEKDALAETWREAAHEAENLKFGTLLEDRRAK